MRSELRTLRACATLDRLSRRIKLAVVSNIDDDLLAATPLKRTFDLVCTAERARVQAGRHALRYLIENADVARDEILHSGQSQFTDMVGGKPLGLTIAWINRRGVALTRPCRSRTSSTGTSKA